VSAVMTLPPTNDRPDMALDQLGRIVVLEGGVMQRWSESGELDASFAAVSLACGTRFLVDSLDRIVVACAVVDYLPHQQGARRVRTGYIDICPMDRPTSLRRQRIAWLPSAGWLRARSLAIHGDKILVGGGDFYNAQLPSRAAVWRLTAAGQVDRSFGAKGGEVTLARYQCLR